MKTTAMVIEHLIIGSQTVVWVLLSIGALFGFGWQDLQDLSIPQVIAVGLALSVVYPLGVFIDEVADVCFGRLSQRIRKKYLLPTQSTLALLLGLKDDTANNYFQYIRSRIRLARSSAINFMLIMIASVSFTLSTVPRGVGTEFSRLLLTEFVVGMVLTGLAAFAWKRFAETYGKWTKRAFTHLEKEKQAEISNQPNE